MEQYNNRTINGELIPEPTDDNTANILAQLWAREEELSVVYELENVTSSSYNLDVLLGQITVKAAQIMHAQDCTIFLTQKNSDELFVRSTQSEQRKQVQQIKVKKGEGIVGTVVATGEPIIANDLSNEPRWKKAISEDLHFKTKSIICTPMVFNGVIIGAIEAINKIDNEDGFLPSDLRVLTIISNQTAKAIETTKILQESQNQDRLATIGKMSYGIIHDIKNPMAIIKGYAELIGMKEPKMSSYTEKIISSIDRLVGMTQELLDYSRGEINLACRTYNVPEFISGFIEMIKNSFEAADIRIEQDIQYNGDICFDKDRMLRVMFNISTNAKDAMPDGGIFMIKVSEQNGEVTFSLRDTGIGMPDNIKKTAFEPFVTHGKSNGTGLGMSITKRIIETHGGRIWLTSEEGVGTEIAFTIPIVIEDEQGVN
ncbi:MAG: GAF domain-containing sensor histidine kinase [Spirochaetales bacterium]|nr:GAF domain-containing sensor histidine kinase [Spirochaetales bacterium]